MKRGTTSHTLGRIGLASVCLAASAMSAHAQISGFNSGTNYTLNDNGGGAASFPTAQSAQMTSNQYYDATSVYYNTQQLATAFTASYTYTLNANVMSDGLSPADGVAFVIQNDSLNELGGAGGYLGYGTASPDSSIAVGLNVYSPNTVGTNLFTQGNETQSYVSTGSVNLASFDPIAVALSYDGTTLSETLTDTVTSATFSTSYVVDIPAMLGQNSGWVGFSGGTGGGTSIQTISDFQYNAVPEPGSLLALGVGGIALFRRRRSSRR